MIRRSALALGALVAVVGLTSCSTLSSNDDVASVNGHHLSQDDVQRMLESELGGQLLGGAPVDGVAAGQSVRALLSAWVVATALTDTGVGADVDRAQIEADLAADPQLGDPFGAAPQQLRDLLIDSQVLRNADPTLTTEDQILKVTSDADIDIDPRYGYWDGTTGYVVAFD
ncbi:MAG: hypothetical protein AB7L17_18645 [Ilumatobacteraceae bacterium]